MSNLNQTKNLMKKLHLMKKMIQERNMFKVARKRLEVEEKESSKLCRTTKNDKGFQLIFELRLVNQRSEFPQIIRVSSCKATFCSSMLETA